MEGRVSVSFCFGFKATVFISERTPGKCETMNKYSNGNGFSSKDSLNKDFSNGKPLAPAPTIDVEATGKNIKKLCKEKHLSCQALGEILKLSPQAVSKMWTGKNLLNIEHMVQLATILEISLDQMFIISQQGAAYTKQRCDCKAKFGDADYMDDRAEDYLWDTGSGDIEDAVSPSSQASAAKVQKKDTNLTHGFFSWRE